MINRIVRNIRNKVLGISEPKNKEVTPEITSSEKTISEVIKPRPSISQSQKPPMPRQKSEASKPEQGSPRPAVKQPQKPASIPRWEISQFDVPPAEGKTRFHDLGLTYEIMRGIFDLGFEYCTPIQGAILPQALKGTDAIGRAQTGTGKSAAFLITILKRLQENPVKGQRANGTPRALVIVPTRELALQVTKDANGLGKYSRVNVVAVFGGMDYQKQRGLLADRLVDIVVATPGRLLDFKRHRDIDLSKVEIMVIDEADQMLDMGFIPDVRQIINSTPPKAQRQTMLFGATLTPEINRMAGSWTRDPFLVDIEPQQVTVDTVDQTVYLVLARERFALLYNLVTQQELKRVMVFCNRRDQTRRLTEQLKMHGINCAMLSGEVAQNKRIQTLESFRSGKIRVMVATDVAGRGIHVDGVSHVINYNLPFDPEDYVHRIGRTGRAGASGISISFATEDESFYLPAIEKFIGNKFNCVYPEAELLKPPPRPSLPKPSKGEGDGEAPRTPVRRSRPRRRPPRPAPRTDSQPKPPSGPENPAG